MINTVGELIEALKEFQTDTPLIGYNEGALYARLVLIAAESSQYVKSKQEVCVLQLREV